MAREPVGITQSTAIGAADSTAAGQSIVVGYDGSPESTSALLWAVAEAMQRRANLNVVVCIETVKPGREKACPPLGPILKVAAQLMAVARPEARPDSFHLQVVQDIPWTRLAAESTGTAMLVIGTSSHLLLGAWRLGAVTHELLQRVTCPVILIPRHMSSCLYHRVVVAVDGTTSDLALRWAAERAEDRASELVVVHVSEQRSGASDPVAARILDDACRRAEQLTCQQVTQRLVDGPITSSLLSQGFHTDVLVLGTGGVHHAGSHSGSVARAIAACATSPTVLIRQPIVHDHDSR
jgi:nucleotide-binding universal stress UspA family protein